MTRSPSPVLIVDDDVDLRDALAETLIDEGYTVSVASNGREGLNHLKDKQLPSVILLDLLMPVMNGWEFCEAVKGDPAIAGIPILGMSGAVSRAPESPYFIAVDDFVAKPINLQDLLAKVRTLHAGSVGPD